MISRHPREQHAWPPAWFIMSLWPTYARHWRAPLTDAQRFMELRLAHAIWLFLGNLGRSGPSREGEQELSGAPPSPAFGARGGAHAMNSHFDLAPGNEQKPRSPSRA